MATIAFDTLKFSKRLKDAGVPERQAEAEAEALAEVLEVNLKDLATKEDLAREIAMVRKDLEWMENRVTERFDARLAALEQRLAIKLGGMMMAAVGIVAALVKLL
jgi:hypothetical protein